MEILKGLIQTLALDQSFFYHLILGIILFFISKNWLFRPYIFAMDQRRKFTKGRLEESGELDIKIQESQKLYDEKAKKIHKDFQELFGKIKEKALESFSKDSLKLEEDQKLWLLQERIKLKENAQAQNKILEKEIPHLKSELLGKIKS